MQIPTPRLRGLLDHPALVLGLAALALHLWVNGAYGYFRDELYYIVCGRRLAWGYTDQPPLTPLIAWASDAAFHSLRGLRLVPALASAATVALTAHAARLLGGGLYARWLAGLAVLGGGALQFFGVTLGTDSLQPLAWLAIALCVIEAERDDEPRWFLAAGAIAGVAFLAKYTVALYLVSLGLGLLATAERRLLARWEPWAGALLALAIAAPNLIWQAENGWPFAAHTAVLAAEKNIPLSPGAFLVQEILTLGPASAPVWIAGVAAFAFWPRFARWRWIAVSWVLLVAAAVIGRGRPYYLAPAYPLLMAGGAVALEAWLPRLAKPAFAALVVAVAALTAPLVPAGPAGRRLRRLRAGDRLPPEHRRTPAARRPAAILRRHVRLAGDGGDGRTSVSGPAAGRPGAGGLLRAGTTATRPPSISSARPGACRRRSAAMKTTISGVRAGRMAASF